MALCGLMLAGAANAQVATLTDDQWGISPKAFSADGEAKLISVEQSGEYQGIINVYNSTFEVEHSFDFTFGNCGYERVTEQRAWVYTPGELENKDISSLLGISEEQWNSLSQEEKISILRTSFYTDIDSVSTAPNGDVYIYVIKRDYFNGYESYRIEGAYILSGSIVKYQPYTSKRTGEWEVINTYGYSYSASFPNIYNFTDLDNDWSYETGASILTTQTLFNSDEKYEYLRYKRTAYNRIRNEWDTDGDGNIDYRELEDGSEIIGIEVVSEDGNVISSFDVGDVEDAHLLLWAGKRYLGFYIYSEDNYTFQIYEINPTGNSITRASSAAFMHILPAMPKKNTSVTVELGEESVKNGGQLMITDMNGRTVYRNAVAPGETSVKVPLRRMASGVYHVTLTNDGQKVETSKLIIR